MWSFDRLTVFSTTWASPGTGYARELSVTTLFSESRPDNIEPMTNFDSDFAYPAFIQLKHTETGTHSWRNACLAHVLSGVALWYSRVGKNPLKQETTDPPPLRGGKIPRTPLPPLKLICEIRRTLLQTERRNAHNRFHRHKRWFARLFPFGHVN